MDSVDQIQQIVGHMTNRVDAADVKVLAGSLKSLETDCAQNPQAVSVIKMMQSVTKYLGTRKDKAHPDTLPVLDTLAGHLKILLISPTAQTLSKSKQTFKYLKYAIESGKLMPDSEMQALKAVILSVDWEISSITMKGFDRVLTRLEKRLKSNKIHYTFLRIMHQIGAHIARRKSGAHQDSVSLLRKVFQQYELLAAHPDMAPGKKKELVQANIQAYNAFKRNIDADLHHNQSPDNSEDDSFAPALSHIDENVSDLQDGLLFALNDPMEDPAAVVSTKGTLSEKTDPTPPQRDVMEDLFSMKESAADQLLDAIHLSNIHGPEQENTAAMPGLMNEDEKKAGVQQVTTQRENKVPIPEIERRLDEFFNLETCAADQTEVQDLPKSQGISHQDIGHKEIPVQEPPQDLVDLGDLLSNPGTLSSPDLFGQIQNKIITLNKIWDSDSDKIKLTDLISGMARFIHQQVVSDIEKNSFGESAEPNEAGGGMKPAKTNGAQERNDAQEKNEAPKGFFARLKAWFKR